MTITSPPPGIPSAQRLAGWIGESLGGEPAELTGIRLIAGGRSNLTYRLAFRADADVVGAPFYLMEYVPGVVLRSRPDTAALTRQQNADLSEGIYARYLQHQTVGEGFEHEGLA